MEAWKRLGELFHASISLKAQRVMRIPVPCGQDLRRRPTDNSPPAGAEGG